MKTTHTKPVEGGSANPISLSEEQLQKLREQGRLIYWNAIPTDIRTLTDVELIEHYEDVQNIAAVDASSAKSETPPSRLFFAYNALSVIAVVKEIIRRGH